MESDPVVGALLEALKRQDSIELRLALAVHLTRRELYDEALKHYEAGLLIDPGNQACLQGASLAAEKTGDLARSAAYSAALHAAQFDSPSEAQHSSSPPSRVSTEEFRAPDEADDAVDNDEVSSFKDCQLRLAARDGGLLHEEGPPELALDDVAGMTDVKKSLERSFLLPIRNPELHRKFGKRVGGGLILYGPPGCGKTYLARALAGEIGARFFNVGLSDVLDMWFGESERKIHELFENTRRRAPAILFFDEIDALGHKRSQLRGAAGRNLVNQLLSEMDGFATNTDDVFFLAATNHPWDVDTALRRPGRFDRLVFVPPPDVEAREQILALRLADRPTDTRLDLKWPAKQTDGFSGADLVALVERATELAIEQSLDKGREIPISKEHLRAGLKVVKPSTGPWLETARNYAVYANEGGSLDDLHDYLRRRGLA